MVSQEDLSKRDFFEELVYTGFDQQERVGTAQPRNFQRFTQDSPVMPDVWIAYAMDPLARHDLLLTPMLGRAPGKLAARVRRKLELCEADPTAAQREFRVRRGDASADEPGRQLSYNQTTVAVRLWFPELIQLVLPETGWWWDRLAREEFPAHHPVKLLRDLDAPKAHDLRADLERALRGEHYDAQRGMATPNLIWMARVVGTIDYVGERRGIDNVSLDELRDHTADAQALVDALFVLLDIPQLEATASGDGWVTDSEPPDQFQLFSVNRNRPAAASIYRSVPTVKGDAAQQLFAVRGQGITWAILDSGIDATHLAFRRRTLEGAIVGPVPAEDTFKDADQLPAVRGTMPPPHKRSRVRKTYDFTRVRALLSEDEKSPYVSLLTEQGRADLRRSLQTGRSVDWEVIEPALEIKHDADYMNFIPRSHHGTHVAGILAADWRGDDDKQDALPLANPSDARPTVRTGVCPEIELYDLRVMGDDGTGDEFSIMAALQFVRALNARADYVVIHGVNLSLSIAHAVANYACGRTPVCNESEHLVAAGTVVVASAGNHGRSRYLTRGGDEEAYSTVSITDPGNAETVITVGATHRQDPHTYGVSYFSSRGPTADGRIKPDLVAPGEKICSTIPGNREEYLDGTSMAAPHVSGAAALLMARYPELIGNPQRIKKVLCDTATDLGRERYFQGAGLLDILRALQAF